MEDTRMHCFDCEAGRYDKVIRDYETTGGKGQPLVIPGVPHLVCDKCGEIVISATASKIIEFAREADGVVYRNHIREGKAERAEVPPSNTPRTDEIFTLKDNERGMDYEIRTHYEVGLMELEAKEMRVMLDECMTALNSAPRHPMLGDSAYKTTYDLAHHLGLFLKKLNNED